MMTALAGVQFLLCVLFVKDYSLEREDDAREKEAAKNWLQERKRKPDGKGGVAGGVAGVEEIEERRKEVEDRV